jgi:hypothetical protein
MARQRTTKSIASRIELDYYKHLHPLRKWRRQLCAAAFVVPFAFLLCSAKFGDRQAWSPGPLAPGHAALEHDCRHCHERGSATAAAACSRCHDPDLHVARHDAKHVGSDHAASPSCASCHRDHGLVPRGAFTRPGDAHCTQCHATAQHGRPAVASLAAHPPFATEAAAPSDHADPGTIRLNHELHLSLGIAGPGQRLHCADCHTPDATGAHMRPIAYETHCAKCHALELAGELAGLRVTHGLAPAALHDELAQLATGRALREEPADAREGTTPLLLRSRHAVADDPTLRSWIDETVAAAETFLAATRCAECHTVARDERGRLASIAPAAIPSRWFAGARFDHRAHHQLGCVECHHDVEQSRATADRLLPRLADCTRCHGRGDASSREFARGDCVECHAYHPRGK